MFTYKEYIMYTLDIIWIMFVLRDVVMLMLNAHKISITVKKTYLFIVTS